MASIIRFADRPEPCTAADLADSTNDAALFQVPSLSIVVWMVKQVSFNRTPPPPPPSFPGSTLVALD